MEKPTVVNVGGSVEKAVTGAYSLDVVAILKEAWQLTLKSRAIINIALIKCLLLSLLVVLLVSSFLGETPQSIMENQEAMALVNILVTLLISPFIVAVEMMGIFHAIGIKTKPSLLYAFLKRGSWVAVCALLISTLTTIGTALFYLPGLFLLVSLSLTLPLIVEKNMTPWQAIILSIKATRFQWFQLFAIYFLLIIFLLLCTTPLLLLKDSPAVIIALVIFVVSLTYLAPMLYHVKGVLYREIFGVQMQATSGEVKQDTDIFNA